MNWVEKFSELYFSIDSDQITVESAYALKDQNLPDRIFKYRCCEPNSFDYFATDRVRLNNPQSFNDPFDSAFSINYLNSWRESFKKAMKQFLPQTGLNQEGQDQFYQVVSTAADPLITAIEFLGAVNGYNAEKIAELKSYFSKIEEENARDSESEFVSAMKSTFKICCFSELSTSILMWSHYAQEHSGFLLEYDIRKIGHDSPFRKFLFPVIYQKHFHDAPDLLHMNKPANYNPRFLNKAALVKSLDWEREKEWRLIFGNGILKQTDWCNSVPPCAIYLGARISSENTTRLVEIAKSKTMRVFQMCLIRNKFELEPKLLHDFSIAGS